MECIACQRNSQRHTYPICENIFEDSYWRVMHAFNTSLPGWLIIGSLRHVETLADLDSKEALALGPLIQKTSKALKEITGASKIYSIMFAEKEHFAHVHFHIVPRHATMPIENRGIGIFKYLNVADDNIVPEVERNKIARQIRALLLEKDF